MDRVVVCNRCLHGHIVQRRCAEGAASFRGRYSRTWAMVTEFGPWCQVLYMFCTLVWRVGGTGVAMVCRACGGVWRRACGEHFFVGGVCQGFGTFVTEIVVHVIDLVGL